MVERGPPVPCPGLLPPGLPGQGAGTELAGESAVEDGCAAACEHSRAQHGQAEAPPVMCLVLPLCFGAANHSTGNKSCSNPGRMAPSDKPHLEAAGKHF